MQKVLVTGATGFIGRILCKQLIANGYQVRALLRYGSDNSVSSDILSNCESIYFDDVENNQDWHKALHGIDVILHLAARVHVMCDTEEDPLSAFRKINVKWTKELAMAAVAGNSKRFVFMSSLHVNGNNSKNKLFQSTDIPGPSTPYAVSKLEAEQELQKIAIKTGLETVIIRPPLVYGPGVKGNFLRLLSLINKGLPFLPFGALNDKRSFIGVNNLVGMLITCIDRPKAANEVFLISDDEDITITNLVKLLARYLGKSRLMLPAPVKLLEALGKLLGKQDVIEKICAPLQVDISKAKQLLEWTPKQSLEEGLKETVDWFQNKA